MSYVTALRQDSLARDWDITIIAGTRMATSDLGALPLTLISTGASVMWIYARVNPSDSLNNHQDAFLFILMLISRNFGWIVIKELKLS